MLKKLLKQSIIALLMIMMVFSLCACSTTEEKENEKENVKENVEEEDALTEIVYAFMTTNNMPTDAGLKAVEEALTEQTKQFGVKMKLMPLSQEEYYTKVNLALSGGVQMDIIQTFHFDSMVSKGAALDITDLSKEYMAETVEMMGEKVLQSTTFDGKLYGITAYKGYALIPTLYYRADIWAETGKDINDVYDGTFASLSAVWDEVKALHPDMIPFCGQFDDDKLIRDFYDEYGYSNLLGGNGIAFDENEGKFICIYTTDAFAERCKLLKEWNEAGYFIGDPTSHAMDFLTTMTAGNAFSYISAQAGNYGANEASQTCGYELEALPLCGTVFTTNSIGAMGSFINASTENPEKACQVLNLLMTDEKFINTIIWGIEGEDYVKTSDVNVTYPDGLDAFSVPYTNSYASGYVGNQFLQYTFEGTPVDNSDVMLQQNEETPLSGIYGFIPDYTDYSTEIASISNAVEHYRNTLTTGSAQDVDQVLKDFTDALQAAGMDKVLEGVQAQLQSWQNE